MGQLWAVDRPRSNYMTRTPESELMADQEPVAAYAAADFSEVNQPIASLFHARLPFLVSGARLLDIGCGTADLIIRLLPVWRGSKRFRGPGPRHSRSGYRLPFAADGPA